ncbi:hypothetical protein [Endozoicomonas sp. 2B-B]
MELAIEAILFGITSTAALLLLAGFKVPYPYWYAAGVAVTCFFNVVM